MVVVSNKPAGLLAGTKLQNGSNCIVWIILRADLLERFIFNMEISFW